MDQVKNYIFTYKSRTFEEYKHDASDTCEDVCTYLCKKLQIAPCVQLLFGLRTQNGNWWLPGCRTLKDGERYEFRLRFKVSFSYSSFFGIPLNFPGKFRTRKTQIFQAIWCFSTVLSWEKFWKLPGPIEQSSLERWH